MLRSTKEPELSKFPEWIEDAVIRLPQLLLCSETGSIRYGRFRSVRVYQYLWTGLLFSALKQVKSASLSKDVGEAALLAMLLDGGEIDIVERSITAGDMSNDSAPLHEAEELFANTTKHTVFGPGNGYRAQKIIDMAAEVVGGHDKLREKPIMTFNCCPTSPLKLVRHVCNAIVISAKNGIPCNILSMVLAGMSGPITMAGSLVVYNAEILAGIILNQAVSKGAPVIYGGSSMVFDMQHLTTPMGSPEVAMLNGAAPKIAQYYNLPSWVAGG